MSADIVAPEAYAAGLLSGGAFVLRQTGFVIALVPPTMSFVIEIPPVNPTVCINPVNAVPPVSVIRFDTTRRSEP
jgi:hypothetical protein